MRKVFLDTNVWLRFILAEGVQYRHSFRLMEQIELGKIRPYTSAVVLLEVNYVLRSFYKVPVGQVIGDLDSIRQTRNLTVIEKTNFDAALELYRKYKIKLADCLIASQVPDGVVLVSFDKDFNKISGLKVALPGEVV